MGVQVYWEDNEQTLLRYDFVGKWTWSDLYNALALGLKMEMLVTNRVDVLIDMRQSGPIGDGALAHIRKIVERQPPNVGMMVVITSSKFVTALFQAAIRAYKNMAHYVRIVPGENEARALIVAARAQDENVINPRALPSNHPSRLAAEKS